MHRLLFPLLAALALFSLRPAAALEPVGPGQFPSTQGVHPVARGIAIDLSTDTNVYEIGEEVRVRFRAGQDSYIYIFATGSDGHTQQIFPNRFEQNNFVRAGQVYVIPSRNYALVATGPAGTETLYAFATSVRYSWIEPHCHGSVWDTNPFPEFRGDPRMLYQGVQHSAEELIRERQAERQRGLPQPPSSGGTQRGGTTIREMQFQPQTMPHPSQQQQLALRDRFIAPAYGEAYYRFRIVAPRASSPGAGWHPIPGVSERADGSRTGGRYRNPGRPYETIPPFSKYEDNLTGTLRISSSPQRAYVYVDGYYVGRTPLDFTAPTGTRDVRVELPGYNPWTRRVTIKQDRRASFTFRLSEQSR